MNACSVIFSHEVLSKKKLIFFGDATKKIIKYLVKENKIYNFYKVVKIQHHGTKRYFTDATPNAEYYLISNGGYDGRNVCELFIRDGSGKSKAGKIYCSCCQMNGSKYCSYPQPCPNNCSCNYPKSVIIPNV